MAEVAKVQPVSYCSVVPPQSDTIVGLLAGEAIAAGDACYIKTSDGKVWKATGAAANAAALVRGFAFTDASVGEPVTLIDAGNFRYAIALSPNADLYLSGTVAGGLADAPSTGGVTPVAFVVDATRIRIRLAGDTAAATGPTGPTGGTGPTGPTGPA
jgi:hypothetical protein